MDLNIGNRLNQLEKLNKKLNPRQELGGVFLPPKHSPKRFDFIFIAEMSSKNKPKDWDGKSNYNFNVTARDKFFHKIIADNGITGNYATDIVKAINIPRRPTKSEVKKWRCFLLKEIEIIQPKNIVVIGKRTYYDSFRPLIQSFIPKNIEVDWVYHYSQQGGKTNVEVKQKFCKVINRLKTINNKVE